MTVLIGVYASLGLITAFESSWTAETAILVSLANIALGAYATQAYYSTFFNKACWLIAFLTVFITLPLSINLTVDASEHIPSSWRVLWLTVTVAAPPVGMLAGAFRPALSRFGRPNG